MILRLLLLLFTIALNLIVVTHARSESTRPNVIFYVIDALRADHVSALGYGRETTPHLDRWARQGALFTQAYAPAPWTKPSMTSILTSLYPTTHGATHGGLGVPGSVPTLATLLRGADYNTLAATDNPFTGRDSNLHRGYDIFLERTALQEEYPGMNSSSLINTVALEWLEKKARPPFFLYLHSMDPHMPYEPSPPWSRKWANPAEEAEYKQWVGALSRVRGFGGGVAARPEDCEKLGIPLEPLKQRMIDRYDGEIAQNDARFGELMEHLSKKGLLENTVVVVLSDHGEAFFEHGLTGHGFSVHEEEIHSYLALLAPGRIPEGTIVKTPVSLIDILPTVLALCGQPVPESCQGRNLLPLIQGTAETPGEIFAVKPAGDDSPEGSESRGLLSVALISESWKAILKKPAEGGEERLELYNRAGDPRDATDVAARQPEISSKMKTRLHNWLKEQASYAELITRPVKQKPDEALNEQMRAIGYVR